MALRTIISIFLLAAIFHNASAQGQRGDTNYLSLDDVIYIAHQQSPDALIAKHRFKSSYWEYRSFRADYLPGLVLDGMVPSYNRGIISDRTGGQSSYYNIEELRSNLNLSLQQKIGRTGGDISLNSGLEFTHNFIIPENPLTPQTEFYANIVNLRYDQPIFQYNPYKWERDIEPMKYEMAKRTYLEDMEQIAITSTNYFFNMLQSQIDVQIADKNYHNYDTLVRIARGRFQLGKIAENELLQLELNLLKAESSLEQAELDLENSQFRLKSFLRIQDEYLIELVAPAVSEFYTISADKAITEAKYNSSTALDFEKRRLEAQSQVNAAKMHGRFDANVGLEFGLNQSGETVPEAYQDPSNTQRVMLNFAVPILDWGSARGRIKMAESNEELVFTSVEQEEIDFVQNIFLQVMQFNMQENQLRIAAKSDTIAKKGYDVTQKRYMIGKVNDVQQLYQAQIDTDNALKGYYNALRSYWRNYYQIRKETLFDFERDMPILFDINQAM